MKLDSKIYVAWHKWLVWSAIVRKLNEKWYNNLILKTREELDLLNQNAVYEFYDKERPEYVIDAAARVWWIKANMTYPANFLFENLQIQNNIIWWAHLHWVKKLLFLWSSCIYPRECPQPMKEEYFMNWKVEPTNEWYALAKISWMKLCEKIYEQYWKEFISCMPTNIYWPWDNFNPEYSHVIPALIRRMHESKINNISDVVIWWTWESRREFLYVDDLWDACVWLMNNYSGKQFLNIWTWKDISIKELAYLIKDVIWYKWKLVFDDLQPDGMPKKLLDISKITQYWWKYSTDLYHWINNEYEDFKKK